NAAVALLKIDKDQGRAVEQLAAALGDPDPGVRRLAAEGLKQAGDAHAHLAWGPLLAALGDPDGGVRGTAGRAPADAAAPPPHEAFPALARALREEGEDVDVWPLRKWAAYVVAQYDGVAEELAGPLTETLREYLEDCDEHLIGPDPGVGRALAMALGGIGPPADAALPLLRDLGRRALRVGGWEVADAVKNAVRELRPPTPTPPSSACPPP